MTETTVIEPADIKLPGPRASKPELVAGPRIRAIVPRNIEEAFRMAQAVVKAGLAPESYENDAQKIMIGILKACEVGLPPLTGLSNIMIVNKRASIWGDGAVALCQSSGLVEKVEQKYEGEPDKDTWTAVYRIWRKGQAEPYEGRFSVADAKRAHLWGNVKKRPWCEYPARMLLARARAFALRDGFADCLSGLSIAEEIQDLPEAPAPVDSSFLDDAPQIEHKPKEASADLADVLSNVGSEPEAEPAADAPLTDWPALADDLIGTVNAMDAGAVKAWFDTEPGVAQLKTADPAQYARVLAAAQARLKEKRR